MTIYDYDLFTIGAGSGGVRAARRFVRRHVLPRLTRLTVMDDAPVRDDKSRLLHFCQRYKLAEVGERPPKQLLPNGKALPVFRK